MPEEDRDPNSSEGPGSELLHQSTLAFCSSLEDGTIAPEWSAHSVEQLAGIFEPGLTVNDRYRLERRLGHGSMGRVFLAKDLRLDRHVAIKVVAHQRSDLETALAREAKLGASLNHPAIAAVLDYGFTHSKSYTVFEYVEGERLRDLLDRRGRLPLDEASTVIATLAAALDFAHAKGIVHRDLKPENICYTKSGQFKILDLGLARDLTSAIETKAYSGTPAYSSPEQARCLPCTAKSDQYALALIGYETLTQRRPFENANPVELLRQQVEDPPPKIRSILPEIPEHVELALTRALSKDPRDRFASCHEFAEALGPPRQGSPHIVTTPIADRVAFYLCHVGEDSLAARRFCQGLEEAGYCCWFYGRDAVVGRPFDSQAEEAIERSAATVLLISRAAVNSRDFAREIEHARRISCPLIPVLLDMSRAEFEQMNPPWRLVLGSGPLLEHDRREGFETLTGRFVSAAEALGIARGPRKHRRAAPPQAQLSGPTWATDANQIEIEDLDRVIYRNELIDEFLQRRNKYFLCGTKGLGKTLLLTYKRRLLTESFKSGEKTVMMIPEGRPFLDFMSEMRSLSSRYEQPLSELSTTKRLWSTALRISVISHHPQVIQEDEAFELTAFPERIRRWLAGAKIQPTVAFKELTSLQISKLNQLIDRTENFLDQKVRQVHGATYLFVDKVDQAIRHLSRDAWIYIQAGLIEAAWEMMNANSHIKVFASIRQEAFTNYESDIKSNLLSAATSLQYADEELAAILDNLTRCYEGADSFVDFLGFQVVRHPSRPELEDCTQLVRRHTFGRPRDWVAIAAELSSRPSLRDETAFCETVRHVSSAVLVPNIFDEVRVLHSCLHDRDARARFFSMIPCNLLRKEEAVRVAEEFNGLAPDTLQHYGEDSQDLHHPFRDLYLSGLLGVVQQQPAPHAAVQRFRQPRDLLASLGRDLPESPFYLIHPALNSVIKQHRTRDPYYQIQHVVVGENLAWNAHFAEIIELEKRLLAVAEMPRFVAAVHDVIKRFCSSIKSGNLDFARAEIYASTDWEIISKTHDDPAAAEVLFWLDELMS